MTWWAPEILLQTHRQPIDRHGQYQCVIDGVSASLVREVELTGIACYALSIVSYTASIAVYRCWKNRYGLRGNWLAHRRGSSMTLLTSTEKNSWYDYFIENPVWLSVETINVPALIEKEIKATTRTHVRHDGPDIQLGFKTEKDMMLYLLNS